MYPGLMPALPTLAAVAVLAIAAGSLAADPVRGTVARLDGKRMTATKIEAAVKRLMSEAKVPGLAVVILNKGQVVYLNGFGLRDVARNEPMTIDTVMYGASFTKSVFAWMVMQLVEEKTLDLDKPVAQYLTKPLPEYEKYRDLAGDERAQRITARMLLSHTSGFPNWRWISDDKQLRIYFEPGSRYAYSGEGIALLQMVIEEITKQSVGELIQQRVFDRFGMSCTSMTWQAALESETAVGYDEEGKLLGHAMRKTPQAAGSMDTTIADFAKFIGAVVRGEGMRRETHDLMLSPQVRIHSKKQFPTLSEETTTENDAIELSYGLGWGVFQTPYGKAFFKEGHDDGWENHCVCFERSKTCVVMMGNSSNTDGTFKELLESLIGDRFTPWRWEGYVPVGSK
jgi:CubicO group peptidase (beta-lactamase class C family)